MQDTCPCNFPGNAASNKRWCCGTRAPRKMRHAMYFNFVNHFHEFWAHDVPTLPKERVH